LSLLRNSELRLTKTYLHCAIIAKNAFGIVVDLSIKRQLAYFKKNIPQKGVSIPMRDLALRQGEHKHPDFLALNPLGQVPALQLDDGRVLTESLSICRYLDALHPEPPMFGTDPFNAAEIDALTRRVELRLQRAVGMTTMPDMPAGMMMAGPPPGPRMGPPPGSPPPGAMMMPPPGSPPPGAMMGPPPPGAIMMMPPPGPLRPALEAALVGTSAGGSYSTAADMERFFAAFEAGKLTSAAMRDQLLTRQIDIPGPPGRPPLGHALGLGIGDYRGHRWFGHNGGTPGVNVETMAFLDDQTSVVVLANRDPPSAMALLRALLPVVIGGAACPVPPA
jgi:hypothetical protein